MKHIAIIGGGPAGMQASLAALRHGANVTLFEKNKVLGRKLLITGKGRCNLSNDLSAREFIESIPNGAKFLYSAVFRFPPEALMRQMENLGVPLKTERGKRVFPVSDQSSDIRNALRAALFNHSGFSLINAAVSEIRPLSNGAFSLCFDSKYREFDAVILATGGLSYPLTGSTGDGYRLAQKLGHTVTPLYPSLVPVVIREAFVSKLEGLSLKNAALTLFSKNSSKPIFSQLGELLFTDFGISGPLALSVSVYLRAVESGRKLELDLKPALSESELDERVLRDFAKIQNQNFKNALNELLPALMRPVIVELSGIEADKKVHQIKKEERARLVSLLKHLPLTFQGLRPIEEAVVTAGGIQLSEIDPHTMESKIQTNLYFAGEMIDVDAFTGGFNLQIAFSTGELAGENAAI